MPLQKLLFIILMLLSMAGVVACAGQANAPQAAALQQQPPSACSTIRTALEKDGSQIDYDTLMSVQQQLMSLPAPSPCIEALLLRLVDQRNPDPRIDQMVLIFAAQVIGKSEFPIPGDQAIFERILNQDAERINDWVLAYVADAVINYRQDLPDGDGLVDRMDNWKAYIDRHRDKDREYFGMHFLPPPRSALIRNHIAAIRDRKTRQRERSIYYFMINNNISEEMIIAAFEYITTHGMPDSGEIPQDPLTAIRDNWQQLPAEAKGLHQE